jgi:hypothetical protein
MDRMFETLFNEFSHDPEIIEAMLRVFYGCKTIKKVL